MGRLDQTVLIWPVLLELLLEELLLVVGDGLFVQDQDLRYVVVVCLTLLARLSSGWRHLTNLLLQVLEHLDALPLDEIQLLQDILHLCDLVDDAWSAVVKVGIQQIWLRGRTRTA